MSRAAKTSQPKKPTRRESPEKLVFTVEVGLHTGYCIKVTVGSKNGEQAGILDGLAIHGENTEERIQYSKRRWEYIKLYIGQAMLDAARDLIEESSLFANPNVDLNAQLDGSLDLRAMETTRRTPHNVTTVFQAQVAHLAEIKQMRLMGCDDRTIKPGKQVSMNTTEVLKAMRLYFDNCFAACKEIRSLGKSDRQTKAREHNMPDNLLAALNKKDQYVHKPTGNLRSRHKYTPRQVAYVWMMHKSGMNFPMSPTYKAIERAVKEIGSPAGYHNVRVIVRTPDSR